MSMISITVPDWVPKLRYALYAAGVGCVVWGFTRTLSNGSHAPSMEAAIASAVVKPESESTESGTLTSMLMRYPLVWGNESLRDVFMRFHGCYHYISVPLGQLAAEFQKLAEIHWNVQEQNMKKESVILGFDATKRVNHIRALLFEAKTLVRNVAVPTWEEDELSLTGIAEDTLTNINRDIHHYLGRGSRNK